MDIAWQMEQDSVRVLLPWIWWDASDNSNWVTVR